MDQQNNVEEGQNVSSSLPKDTRPLTPPFIYGYSPLHRMYAVIKLMDFGGPGKLAFRMPQMRTSTDLAGGDNGVKESIERSDGRIHVLIIEL